MSSKADGIFAAHLIVCALVEEIEKQHKETPSFFGFPTREHHQLIGGSRALKELGWLLVKAHGEALKESSNVKG